MSAFKGTPGPWQVVNGTDVFTPLAARNGAGVEASATDGWYIADCSMGETQTDEGEETIPYHEQVANAHLIAAAPRLLSNLEFAVKLLSMLPGIGGTSQIENMRSVIAEALGGES